MSALNEPSAALRTGEPVEVVYGQDTLHFDPVTHTYHLNQTPLKSVTQYLKESGYCHPWHGNGDAAAFGRYVHEATVFEDFEDLDTSTLDPRILARVEAYWQFKTVEEFIPDLRWRERPCFHPIYRWAGTPDVPGQWKGKPCIVDIKTGQPERWHALQVGGGYTPMLAAHDPAYKESASAILYLHEDGTYNQARDFIVVTDKKLPALFAALVATVNGRDFYGPSA